jgi:hypothetical protein
MTRHSRAVPPVIRQVIAKPALLADLARRNAVEQFTETLIELLDKADGDLDLEAEEDACEVEDMLGHWSGRGPGDPGDAEDEDPGEDNGDRELDDCDSEWSAILRPEPPLDEFGMTIVPDFGPPSAAISKRSA